MYQIGTNKTWKEEQIMAQKKEAPLSLQLAQYLVLAFTHASDQNKKEYADFYRHALYEACEVQNINQEEYKLLLDIVNAFIPEE